MPVYRVECYRRTGERADQRIDAASAAEAQQLAEQKDLIVGDAVPSLPAAATSAGDENATDPSPQAILHELRRSNELLAHVASTRLLNRPFTRLFWPVLGAVFGGVTLAAITLTIAVATWDAIIDRRHDAAARTTMTGTAASRAATVALRPSVSIDPVTRRQLDDLIITQCIDAGPETAAVLLSGIDDADFRSRIVEYLDQRSEYLLAIRVAQHSGHGGLVPQAVSDQLAGSGTRPLPHKPVWPVR